MANRHTSSPAHAVYPLQVARAAEVDYKGTLTLALPLTQITECFHTPRQGLCAFKGSTGDLSQPLACPEYILSVRLGAHSVSKQTNSSELGQFRAPERV